MGLPMASEQQATRLCETLNDIANEYHWQSFAPNVPEESQFDRLASFPVTPSTLRIRLEQIVRSAHRLHSGRSRKPIQDKIVELLNRLGFDRNGTGLRFSGDERPGHGGSERVAVRLALTYAIIGLERPPHRYRAQRDEPAWATQQLNQAITTLVRSAAAQGKDSMSVVDVARTLERWAQHAREMVAKDIVEDHDRHRGEEPLNATLLRLADVYRDVFDKRPTTYLRRSDREHGVANAWGRFLAATLAIILGEDNVPTDEALMSRWRRVSRRGM